MAPIRGNFVSQNNSWLPYTTSYLLESGTNVMERQRLSQDIFKWNSETGKPKISTNYMDYIPSSRSHDLGQFEAILASTSVIMKGESPEETLLQGFVELYLHRDTADVSIICGNNCGVVKAHRVVLSCCSMHFNNCLKGPLLDHPIIAENNIPVDVMDRIVEFMYLGQVKINTESEMKQFISTAKYLMVNGIDYDYDK